MTAVAGRPRFSGIGGVALLLALLALAPGTARAEAPRDPLDCPLRRTLEVDFRGGPRHSVEVRRCATETERFDALLISDPAANATVLRLDNFEESDTKFLERVERLRPPDAGGRAELLVLWRRYGSSGTIEWCLLGWRGGALRCREVDDVDGPAGALLAEDEHLCCKGWNLRREGDDLRLERPVFQRGDPSCCPTRSSLFAVLRPRGGRLVVDRLWREP